MIALTEQEKREMKDKYRKMQEALHSAMSEAKKKSNQDILKK